MCKTVCSFFVDAVQSVGPRLDLLHPDEIARSESVDKSGRNLIKPPPLGPTSRSLALFSKVVRKLSENDPQSSGE